MTCVPLGRRTCVFLVLPGGGWGGTHTAHTHTHTQTHIKKKSLVKVTLTAVPFQLPSVTVTLRLLHSCKLNDEPV